MLPTDVNLFRHLRQPSSPSKIREMSNTFKIEIYVPGLLPRSIFVERMNLIIASIAGYTYLQLCESLLVLSFLQYPVNQTSVAVERTQPRTGRVVITKCSDCSFVRLS